MHASLFVSLSSNHKDSLYGAKAIICYAHCEAPERTAVFRAGILCIHKHFDDLPTSLAGPVAFHAC